MGDAFTGDDDRRQGREGVDHEGGRIPSNPPNFLAWPPESSRATMPKSVGLPRVASCLKWTRAKCGRRSIWSRGKISRLKNQGSNKVPRKTAREELVELLNGGAVVTARGSTGSGARGTAGHATGSAASSRVDLGHDGVDLLLDLLLLVLELVGRGGGVGVEPLDALLDDLLERLLVGGLELVLELGLVGGVADVVDVRLETVLGLGALEGLLVLLGELLGLLEHLLDLLRRETALVVADGDLLRLAGALLGGRDVENGVGVDVEGDLDLRNTTGGGGDTRELELAEQVVVLGAGTLTLEDLDQHTGLVVGVGREDLGLLGGHSGVALDEGGEDTTGGLDTHRERGNVEEEQVLGLLRGVTRENGGLDGGTVCDGLVGVDRLVELAAVEEVGEELLDLGDTGGTTDEDDLVDGSLVDLGVAEDLLDGLDRVREEVTAELLETGTGDGGVEVDTLEERVDLDGGLGSRRESALSALTGGAETTEGTGVGGQVLLVLALELLDEVVDETVVKVLTTKVGVTSGGLDLEDTLLDGEERDIEGTSTKIEDEDVLLTLGLLVETVSDGGGSGLVDDAHHVEARDDTGILGGLTLRVVEVGGDGDDGILDGATEVGLGSLAHLEENHGRNLLGGEGLLLALVLDADLGLTTDAGDLEGPVLHVGLDLGVVELAADETLGVEDGVVGVHGDLVLGSIADETLRVGEGDIGGGGAVTLIVGNDLDAVVLPDGDTRVGGTEIDADSLGHDGGAGSFGGGKGFAVWNAKRQVRAYVPCPPRTACEVPSAICGTLATQGAVAHPQSASTGSQNGRDSGMFVRRLSGASKIASPPAASGSDWRSGSRQ
ncbi:hypothetical protein L1887_51742 [Cichorium endivia]|nr:hypothetical protein L1887_51742 [Cichorium endivia]